MTEEERRAIETLQYLCSDDCINKDIIKTIVNLIDKLQKENEELRVQGSIVYLDYKILKGKIREKIKEYQNETECENSYLEQGIICEEEYKDRVKVYNSYIFILNKLLEEE